MRGQDRETVANEVELAFLFCGGLSAQVFGMQSKCSWSKPRQQSRPGGLLQAAGASGGHPQCSSRCHHAWHDGERVEGRAGRGMNDT